MTPLLWVLAIAAAFILGLIAGAILGVWSMAIQVCGDLGRDA